MATDSKEEVQGGRAAYCEVHRLRYDPAAPGCPLCLRAEVASPGSTRGRLRGWFLLLGLVVLVVLLIRTSSPPPEERSPGPGATGEQAEAPSPTPWRASSQVDPRPYTREIRDLERLLYASQAPGLNTGQAIEAAARRLGDRLLAGGDPARQQIGTEILYFGTGVGSEEDAGYATIDLPRTRRAWEELRDRVFSSAVWFRQTAPGLEERQTPRAPQADLLIVTELRSAADAIEILVEEAQGLVVELGEVTGEGDPERRSKEAAWTLFAREWERRLVTAGPRLPPTGDQPTSVLLARQSLEAALHELRLLPVTAYSWTNVPAFYERERHLESARASIAAARQYLEDATP